MKNEKRLYKAKIGLTIAYFAIAVILAGTAIAAIVLDNITLEFKLFLGFGALFMGIVGIVVMLLWGIDKNGLSFEKYPTPNTKKEKIETTENNLNN